MDNYFKHIRDERLRKIIRAQQVLMWIPIVGSAASIVLMQIVLYKRGSEKIAQFDFALVVILSLLVASYFLVSKLFTVNPAYSAIIYIAALFFITFFAAYTGLGSEIKIIYETEQEGLTRPAAQIMPAVTVETAANVAAVTDETTPETVAWPVVAVANPRDTALAKHEDMTLRHVSLYLTPAYIKKLAEAGCPVNFELVWMSGKLGKNTEILYSRPAVKRGYACYFSLSAAGEGGKKGIMFKLSEINFIGGYRTYSRLDRIFEAVEGMTGQVNISNC